MADMQKKVILPFFDRLKLLDWSCVRWHLGITSDYKNDIGGILNVSFCSLCLFCEKNNNYKKIWFMVKVRKIAFLMGVYAIYGNVLSLAVSACANLIFDTRQWESVRVSERERERPSIIKINKCLALTNLRPQGNWESKKERKREGEREREWKQEREKERKREKMDRMESRVIDICIWQWRYLVAVIKLQTNDDFRGAKKEKALFSVYRP
jgi:hypothetical protein